MADTMILEHRHIGSRCADADRLAAVVDHGSQLRQEDVAETGVDRGEVGDPERPGRRRNVGLGVSPG